MPELSLFDAVEKQRWALRGDSVPPNGSVFSSGFLISLSLCDSSARSGSLYQTCFSLHAAFFKSLI